MSSWEFIVFNVSVAIFKAVILSTTLPSLWTGVATQDVHAFEILSPRGSQNIPSVDYEVVSQLQ